MAVSKKGVLKKTLQIRDALDSTSRHMVYTPSIAATQTKAFFYKTPDLKLLSFARDEVASVSDCFILYAIGHMGAAEKQGICMFLKAFNKKYPSLSITDYSAVDALATLHNRLNALTKNGFLFRNSYRVGEDDVSLFSATEDSYHIVRQKIGKMYAINSWLQAKNFPELMGWAAGAYVGACIAQDYAFEGFLERVLRTRLLGAVFLPSELKMRVDDDVYYVAVISAFLYHDTRIMTDSEYKEFRVAKLNTIKNYLLARTQKATAMVVITVADNSDLNEMAELIMRAGFFGDFLDRIFFTGEGAMRNGLALEDSFLRIVLDDSEKGYSLLMDKPPFVK